jgi:hypothetical protein
MDGSDGGESNEVMPVENGEGKSAENRIFRQFFWFLCFDTAKTLENKRP